MLPKGNNVNLRVAGPLRIRLPIGRINQLGTQSARGGGQIPFGLGAAVHSCIFRRSNPMSSDVRSPAPARPRSILPAPNFRAGLAREMLESAAGRAHGG